MSTGTIMVLSFFAGLGGWLSGYTYFCNPELKPSLSKMDKLKNFIIPGAMALLVGGSLFLLNKLIASPEAWLVIGLLIIILLSGSLGGLIGYYYRSLQSNTPTGDIRISILMGVGAALLVPLLLHILTSNLLFEVKKDMEKSFILAGFCISAGISSDVFIHAIIDKFNQMAQPSNRPNV